MGKAMSTARRFVRNFDVEARAIKHLENSKTIAKAAPKHPNTPKTELDQRSLDQLFTKNPDLERRVDRFQIQSTPIKEGILPEGFNYVTESTRRLPQKIMGADPFPDPHVDFGFVVPDVVPRGRLTMRQAVELVKSFQTQKSTVEELAEKYNVDESKVSAIVDYFVLFTKPSKSFWMPPMLLPNSDEDVKLLDEPVEIGDAVDEPIGGASHSVRRDALRGVEPTHS